MPITSHAAERSRPDPPVIAWLCRRDFERARAAPGFSDWRNHREFFEERDALYLGYGFAGVTARLQRVPFDAFERWTRLTGTALEIDGLDEFAAHWSWRATHVDAPVIGRFGAPGDPERNAIAVAGAQCVCVRREVYVRWRDEFARSALLPAPNLDVYAAHVVDCCIPCRPRARRATVNSA